MSDPTRTTALPKYPGTDRTLCAICGCTPAAYATFRQHTGLILVWLLRTRRGMFCRDCGLETFRGMTALTLLGGWWGVVSFFITPVVLLLNAANRPDVASLPEPQPGPSGRYPVEPGRPLFARPPAVIGALLPVVILALFVSSLFV